MRRRVFDGLGELGQALGVEGVGAVEKFEVGLIEIDDRDALELEAVLREAFQRHRLDPMGIILALLMHLLERHLRGDGSQRRGEAPFQQVARAVRLQGSPAQRLRGEADGFARRADLDEELGDDVDAHAVLGDQRLSLAPLHLDAHHRHVDRRDVVQHRNDESAAAHDDFLAAEPGAHERRLLGRALVEPAQQIDGDHDGDRQDDQPKDQRSQGFRGHCVPP